MEPSTIANQPPANASESPEDWVEQFGDLLFRTAVSRVGDREVAQDLVQEALLAAWRGRESFDGRSQRSTWLVAILKRKIADHFRATGRSREVSPSEEEGCELFDERGLWKSSVGKVSFKLETRVEREEFWQALKHCVAELPATLAQAFAVRELQALPPNDAAEHLGITRQNLAVRLHRARLLLRGCLETRWMGEREARR